MLVSRELTISKIELVTRVVSALKVQPRRYRDMKFLKCDLNN